MIFNRGRKHIKSISLINLLSLPQGVKSWPVGLQQTVLSLALDLIAVMNCNRAWDSVQCQALIQKQLEIGYLRFLLKMGFILGCQSTEDSGFAMQTLLLPLSLNIETHCYKWELWINVAQELILKCFLRCELTHTFNLWLHSWNLHKTRFIPPCVERANFHHNVFGNCQTTNAFNASFTLGVLDEEVLTALCLFQGKQGLVGSTGDRGAPGEPVSIIPHYIPKLRCYLFDILYICHDICTD